MGVFRNFCRAGGRLHRDEGGAVLVWFTTMILTIVGMISLALEASSYMHLHSNLQAVADAAALSGAKELDGAKGARTRATAKAQSYLNNNVSWSNIALTGSQIASVKFYSSLGVLTNSDKDAAFIEVTTVSRSIATSFKQLVTNSDTISTTAKATASSQFVVCAPVQSFMCNPFEDSTSATNGDASTFLSASGAKIGNMFKLVEGGGAPGDWGLIQPPGTSGNPNKNQPPWWSKSGTDSCAATKPGQYVLTTSPGNTAKFAVEGQNVRFDSPSSTTGVVSTSGPIVIGGYAVSGTKTNYTCSHVTTSATPTGPAPKKLAFSQTNKCSSTTECTKAQTTQSTAYVNYCSDTSILGSCPLPRDRVFSQLGKSGQWGSALMGSGVNAADLAAYWANHHPGTMPSTIKTRYDLYKQEVADIGNASGVARFTTASEAKEPSTPQCTMAKPAGGLERRLINVAIVDCDYWDVKGRSALPPITLTARFFMTEPAQSDGSIYAELVDVLQSNVTGGPGHQLVRLVK